MLSSRLTREEAPFNVVELRRYQRAVVDVAVEFSSPGSNVRTSGKAKDISVGGMYIETAHPAAFNTQVIVHMAVDGQRTPLHLPATVRWVRASEGMGLQFGLLGARETHAITELTRTP
jgi:hypothetical protein